MNYRRILPLVFAGLTACGIPIAASEPLLYVAPLEGTWTGDVNPNEEFRVTIPGGQPKFMAQFDFSVDIVTPGGTTSYDGSADEEMITLRDQGSGAIVLTGDLRENTFLRLSDGRAFVKPFQPDLLGVWEDVNKRDRYYVLEAQAGAAGSATGCAAAASSQAESGELQGALVADYQGDEIDLWRVESESRLLAVRSPGFFVGHSAIRIKRIDGYLHLQRVQRSEICR